MNSQQRREYILQVIWALVGKTPEEYRMNNAEFGVLETWMDKKIPLAVVLQTIEQMPKHPSVLYIKSAVEEEMKRRDRAIV
jgi:hypothetical protein